MVAEAFQAAAVVAASSADKATRANSQPLAFSFPVSESIGNVSALWQRPKNATSALVLAHGAGAGMEHAFIQTLATQLSRQGSAVLRFQFPYREIGRRAPDRPAVLIATLRAAINTARERCDSLPLFAGGKSLGGRMAAHAASEREGLPGVKGLIFVGFPLHPAGKPGTGRAEPLRNVTLPMLFLQGTRDKLADLERFRPILKTLGARASLHEVDGADHSFHVLKRSGRSNDEVQQELAQRITAWIQTQI